jgi:fucose 4-O-acetylase-like acetyltransferase
MTKPHDPRRDRVDWIDGAKGVMIVLVVFGHAWRGLHSAGLIAPDLFAAVDARIYAFHMPVFFALSGWFFLPSLERQSVPGFLRRRALRLFWPMVLWTYVFLGTKVLAGSFANSPAGLADLMVSPVPGVAHFWFLWALLLLNLAFLAVKPAIRDGRVPGWLFGGLALVVAGLQVLPLPGGLAGWIGNAVANAPFFLLGLVAGQYGARLAIGPGLRLLAAAIFGAGLAAWPALSASGPDLIWSLILTVSALVLLSCPAPAPLARAFTALGAASMAIYLAHTIFSAALREALLVLGVEALTPQIILGTLIGIAGPLFLLWVARRTRTVRILGF